MSGRQFGSTSWIILCSSHYPPTSYFVGDRWRYNRTFIELAYLARFGAGILIYFFCRFMALGLGINMTNIGLEENENKENKNVDKEFVNLFCNKNRPNSELFIDQACSFKMAGYWLRSYFAC